ncbi:alpha/beta hydrolase [uncultured Deefgea sp.]|uniref:RBBP9/YdeN family alpha/beta hydrolase n=1 Tax=uncultured Deefgea sp. TaxID=1304914 RepID=UPI00259669E8|nr:alpha/beta fold hydrolase [uncultured Deefgea sp.]
MNFLIVPGLGDSSEAHWQSRWEKTNANFSRVEQASWDYPQHDAWLANLDAAVQRSGPETILIAHSLGCLLVANWAAQTTKSIRGAFLVAPPDPHHPNFPKTASGFEHLSQAPLPFPSMVVTSSNDPYASLEFAIRTATAWGSSWKNLGAYGHINVESGFGDWPAGLALLNQLLSQCQQQELSANLA